MLIKVSQYSKAHINLFPTRIVRNVLTYEMLTINLIANNYFLCK